MKNITYEVPKNNREVFLCPALDRIPELILENRRKISGYTFEINGIPFQEFRDNTRMEVLRRAVCYTNGITSLLRKDKSVPCLYVRNSTHKIESWRVTQDKLCTEQQGRNQKTPLFPPFARGDTGGCKILPKICHRETHFHESGDGEKKFLQENTIDELTLDYETIKNIPIVQTGHEPILYHPGIWIKNHLAHYLVNKLDGIGVNMIVDNDACNRGFMYVPMLSEKSVSVGKVALVRNKDHVAYEEIVFDDFGSILQFKEEVINLLSKNILREDVKTTMEDMQDMFGQFINRIGEYYQQGCHDMVGLMTAARRSLEVDFGIGNLEVPVSWMCDTDGFYHFLLHILYEAERFANIYNEKLAEYRRIHKIRSKANPLPDLEILGDAIEIPFWVWKAGGQRAKCYMVNEGENIKITDEAEVLVTLNKGDEVINTITRLKTVMETGIKIRPRAITTTMFSRLFFADVFIHGIGGAKYDTITDEIIKEFFGVDPPSFVTISATLYVPLDAYDLDIKVLQEFHRTVSDMSYNPEQYASKETQSEPAFMNRVSEKQRLLKMMTVGNADEKKRYFSQIKELNNLMLTQINLELKKIQGEIDVMRDKLAYNEVVRFREYPVCLYPMKALQGYLLNVFS